VASGKVNLATGSRRKSKQKTKGIPYLLYAGVGLVAVLVVYALIQVGRPEAPSGDVAAAGLDPGIPRGVTAEGLHYLGSSDAEVTIREYEDFGCHNCRAFAGSVEPKLIDEYITSGKVRLVSFPVAFVNSQSLPGAEAAACAAEQDKFWEYRYLLFANQGISAFDRTNLIAFAGAAGLDMDSFASCLDEDRYLSSITDQTRLAQRFGINGTPTFEIGGSRYEGLLPFDSSDPQNLGMVQIIERTLSGN
jgi:protein-disulfide isomerase